MRTYPCLIDEPELRTHEQTLAFAQQAEHSGVAECGVKGMSLFYLLPNFDIISGFNPEYMHAILQGVVRQIVNLWFDSPGRSYQAQCYQ